MKDSDQVPTLSISIVNTDNRELLRKCLATIASTVQRTSHETIVVDNASTDGSADMVAAEFPDVRVVRNATREGYGSSHNRAIDVSRGKFLLILNEDMEILDGAIDTMVAQAAQQPNLGALGCRILNPDRSLQHSCFNFPTIGQELFEAMFPCTLVLPTSRLRSKLYHWPHDTLREVDIVVGCCMLVPRHVIETVGRFDPLFFVYNEEHDWCKRIKNAGLRVVFTPDAEMIHYGGQTSKRMSLKMAMVQLDSRTKYFRKHHGPLQATLFRGILALGALLRATGWGVRMLFTGRTDKNSAAKFTEYCESLKFVARWKY
jgi:GT2 family glycosyltransferase